MAGDRNDRYREFKLLLRDNRPLYRVCPQRQIGRKPERISALTCLNPQPAPPIGEARSVGLIT